MKRKGRFMVVAVRHFENGEHHWLAPEAADASAFGETGGVRENAYHKPVFESMADAERWAASLLHGEWTLAQWEESRPTFHVVDEETFVAVLNRDHYGYPADAERWSDEKAADFERECDCEDFVNCSFWNSDDERETATEAAILLVNEINDADGIEAWVIADGRFGVSSRDGSVAARSFVEERFGDEVSFERQLPDCVIFYAI